MRVDPIHHYSLENHPTIIDEESLTALELCSRLAHKVQECIQACNDMDEFVRDNLDKNIQKMITELVQAGRLTYGTYPTGDTTGKRDRETIQYMLDTYGFCNLNEGEFYLDQPLTVRAGNVLTGKGNLATRINCQMGFVTIAEGASADHLLFEGFGVYGPSQIDAIGFQLEGSGSEPYTGARYSTFRDVTLYTFTKGLTIRGAWCTHFEHCRFTCDQMCVEQTGTCNNVVYDHCMFLGSGSSTGVYISAQGGVENYGISFRNCDFERHSIGLRAYYVNGLNITDIYAEGVATMFQIDSCHNFSCEGGYLSYITRLCNVTRSNTGELYKGCRGVIRNLFCTLSSASDTYLVTASEVYPVELENVQALNRGGSGRIFYYDRDITQGYAGGCDYPKQIITTAPVNIAGIGGAYLDMKEQLNNCISLRNRESLKLIKAELIVPQGFTSGGAGKVYVENENGTAWSFNINTTTYTTGQVIAGTPTVANLVTPNADSYTFNCYGIMPDNSAANVQVRLTFLKGEMIAMKGAK